MLTLVGNERGRFCDGLSRRSFLQIGGLALGGMTLPQILQAEANAGIRASHKAIIMVFLPGGPPHQDMWEIKTEAPSEMRGEFNPIETNVPGIEICEHFPKLAGMMDKLVVIRSIVGSSGEHAAHQCLSGYSMRDWKQTGRPSMGSYLSKLYGPIDRAVPPFVGLSPKMGHTPWSSPGEPGFLGTGHKPFSPTGPSQNDMVLNGVSLDRLNDRQALLGSLDRFRRDADSSGMMEGMDAFTQRAFGVLTSSKLFEAMDLEREDPRIRDRYGYGVNENKSDGGPRTLTQFLMARRLVEAGVRCVTLSFSRWDWHGSNFAQGRTEMPMLDQAVSALVQDLHDRGMDKDVSVVVWGEFGRTPRINKGAGRDHWPQVSNALLACGGISTGQAIGATNRLGEYAKERPVHFHEVFATLYRNLGIDVGSTTVENQSGRPMFLVDTHEPMHELV